MRKALLAFLIRGLAASNGLVLAACGGAEPAPPPPAASATASGSASSPPDAPKVTTRTLEADAQIALPGGGSLKAPKGWHVTEAATHVVLEEPGREVSLLIALGDKDDPAKAIEAAWKRLDPAFDR